MIATGSHLEFVAWAYAGVAVVTVALTAWMFFRARRARAVLAALEQQGIARESRRERGA